MLEAIALAAIVYGGSLMIPPGKKKKESIYEGRINAEKKKEDYEGRVNAVEKAKGT